MWKLFIKILYHFLISFPLWQWRTMRVSLGYFSSFSKLIKNFSLHKCASFFWNGASEVCTCTFLPLQIALRDRDRWRNDMVFMNLRPSKQKIIRSMSIDNMETSDCSSGSTSRSKLSQLIVQIYFLQARYFNRLSTMCYRGIPTTLRVESGNMFKDEPGPLICSSRCQGQRQCHQDACYDTLMIYAYPPCRKQIRHPHTSSFYATTF